MGPARRTVCPFYAAEPTARLGGSAMLVYEGEFDTRVAAARALDNQVKRLLFEGQYPAAMLPAEEAVEMSPSTATAHDMYGVTLLYNGYSQQALGECSAALKMALPDIEGREIGERYREELRVHMANVIRMQALGQR